MNISEIEFMTRAAPWLLAASVFTAFPAESQQADFAADIAEMTQRIEDAEQTVVQFDGGVIKALVQYRLEVLKMNRVLLENRQLGALGIEF